MEKSIKVHILHCGEVGVDPAVPFREYLKILLHIQGLEGIKNYVFGFLFQHI